MLIGVSGVSVYTYSHIPLDSLDWNEAQKMQRNSNTSVLPGWAESHGEGGTKGGNGKNAVWHKNNKIETFNIIVDATVEI